jgi:hypothetical protein
MKTKNRKIKRNRISLSEKIYFAIISGFVFFDAIFIANGFITIIVSTIESTGFTDLLILSVFSLISVFLSLEIILLLIYKELWSLYFDT